MMTLHQAKATGILERPNDTKLYIVWIGFSVYRMTWRQMTDLQRWDQLEAEHRDYHVWLNNIDLY